MHPVLGGDFKLAHSHLLLLMLCVCKHACVRVAVVQRCESKYSCVRMCKCVSCTCFHSSIQSTSTVHKWQWPPGIKKTIQVDTVKMTHAEPSCVHQGWVWGTTRGRAHTWH
eukprot:1156636-Pelagomonas_calceolata.AAC.17